MANSKRRKGQKYTRQVRASIIAFLRGIEFAPYAEIYAHVRADETLDSLSPSERVRVAGTVLKAPVFISFTTANVVGKKGYKRLLTLWKNNPNHVDWRVLHAQRKKD